MKNEENNTNLVEEPAKKCDLATKPPSSPRPPGYSDRATIECNTSTGEWYWSDPQVAP